MLDKSCSNLLEFCLHFYCFQRDYQDSDDFPDNREISVNLNHHKDERSDLLNPGSDNGLHLHPCPMAVLILLAASARTWIVSADLYFGFDGLRDLRLGWRSLWNP